MKRIFPSVQIIMIMRSNYVASVDSNKFHEPSCSQAHRIKDSNKITFLSRDECYGPCEIDYP